MYLECILVSNVIISCLIRDYLRTLYNFEGFINSEMMYIIYI